MCDADYSLWKIHGFIHFWKDLGHLKHDVQWLCGIIVVASDDDDAGASGNGTGSECHLWFGIFRLHLFFVYALPFYNCLMIDTKHILKVGPWKHSWKIWSCKPSVFKASLQHLCKVRFCCGTRKKHYSGFGNSIFSNAPLWSWPLVLRLDKPQSPAEPLMLRLVAVN